MVPDVDVCVYICGPCLFSVFFFFKQKTAYEMRISDWSSDVCSSDLIFRPLDPAAHHILMRRHSHLGSELPGEVRHAHRGEIAQILEAQSHLQRVFDIVRHHPQPMPAKSMPRRLGLTVAAILADQSSRNRKRKLVDMQ